MDGVSGLLSVPLRCLPAPGCLIWYSKCPLIILELEGERHGESGGKGGKGFICILVARRLWPLIPLQFYLFVALSEPF